MIKWTIDPSHSEVGFKVKHLMITNVKGYFKDYNAVVTTVNEEFDTPTVEFTAKTTSVDTANEQRDQHLRSADFFDSENYPEIKFVSTGYEKEGNDSWKLKGDLTIKGITKPVLLDVEFVGKMKDPWGNIKVGFTVNGKINRKDWGLNWNAALETGGVLVSDEVKIVAEIQLLEQK